ncbi:MAG: type II toxin-antitoxin system VapC family toxin [Gemmatimonadaceae bacterium]
MIVPDLNLLLYAVHKESPKHALAASWLEALLTGDEPVGLPWAVSLGFIRITTNPRVFPMPLPVDVALRLVDAWYDRRIVIAIDPGDQHWRVVRTLLTESGTAANLTSDAHLAALCIERGATLHTADADFGRFKGLRWMNPLAS